MTSLPPRKWPQALLISLTLAVLVCVFVALSTSTVAFGVYNPNWDGASGLLDLAAESDTDVSVALTTRAYDRATSSASSVEEDRTLVVVLSPNESYSTTDRERLRNFVARGGTLVVAEDTGPGGNSLLAAVGAGTRFDSRPVRDERYYYRSPAFPNAVNVTESPETRGVERLTLNHGTTLQTTPNARDIQVLVRTSPFAYLDGNRNDRLDPNESMAARPVVVRERVGDGTVISISDPSIFINAMLDRPGNRRFARNLLETHERVILDYSGYRQKPPLTVALLTVRDSAPLQLLLGVVCVVPVLLWSRRPTAVQRTFARLRSSLSSRAADPETTSPTRVSDQSYSPVDAEALVAYLERKHPEWEEGRIRRVVTGILSQRREDK